MHTFQFYILTASLKEIDQVSVEIRGLEPKSYGRYFRFQLNHSTAQVTLNLREHTSINPRNLQQLLPNVQRTTAKHATNMNSRPAADSFLTLSRTFTACTDTIFARPA